MTEIQTESSVQKLERTIQETQESLKRYTVVVMIHAIVELSAADVDDARYIAGSLVPAHDWKGASLLGKLDVIDVIDVDVDDIELVEADGK